MIVRRNRKRHAGSELGFSLIELMVVLFILLAVSAIVLEAWSGLAAQSTHQSLTVDLLQQNRQFIDQIAQDIHQCGYPTTAMFDSSRIKDGTILTSTLASGGQACGPGGSPVASDGGLISVATDALQFEGDIDNSGTVSEVFIQLVNPDGTYPCTASACKLQRGTEPKTQCLSGGTPPYYTEVDNVLNKNIFAAYSNPNGDDEGYQVTLPANASTGTLQNIHTITVTLSIKAPYGTTKGTYPIVSIQSAARIANH